MFSGNGEALAFVNDANFSESGENCLNLNVWSTSLDPSARRPVMVWLHGGGFTSGSSGAMPSYDGENLARRGVVLVSLNHRLGPVGFMDLSAVGGQAFAKSGNVGMLDLALGLQWVRDNIAGFGGDPARVTIFGQSGGGGKVSTLMAMPDAKGLFHRGVVMSGSFPAGNPAAQAQALTAATMAELGLQPGDVAGLQSVEAGKLIAAANAAAHKLSQGPGGAPSSGMPRLMGFGPVLDGAVLPEDWQTTAPRISADVPMIIGNTRDEFRPPNLSYTEATLPNAVPPPHRAQAAEIIGALRKTFPDQSPTELGAIVGAMFMRNMSVGQATKKHALGAAPVYSYWYTWQSPILDGRIGAPHGSDIPAAFDNTRKSDQFTGNTLESQRLATVVSQAWINFAATGDPSQPGLAWPAFNPDRVPTMIFDNRVRLEDDPAGDARRMLA
jgi:para-nitrobenzyl esterase